MQCEFGNLNDLHEFFDQELSWTIGKHAVFDQRRSFGWIQRFGSCRSLPPKEVQPNCVLTKSCRWATDLSNFVHVIPWGFVTEASNNNQRCRHSFSCFLFGRHKAQCCNLPWHDQDDLDVGNLAQISDMAGGIWHQKSNSCRFIVGFNIRTDPIIHHELANGLKDHSVFFCCHWDWLERHLRNKIAPWWPEDKGVNDKWFEWCLNVNARPISFLARLQLYHFTSRVWLSSQVISQICFSKTALHCLVMSNHQAKFRLKSQIMKKKAWRIPVLLGISLWLTASKKTNPKMTVPKEVPISTVMTWPVEVGMPTGCTLLGWKILSQCCKNWTISSGSCLISDQTDQKFLQKAKNRPNIDQNRWPGGVGKLDKAPSLFLVGRQSTQTFPEFELFWGAGILHEPGILGLCQWDFFLLFFYFDVSWGLFNTQAGDGSRCLSYFT